MAAATGLVGAWDAALIGTYSGLPFYFPGQVLADLAVPIADGATSIWGLKSLRDQPGLFGPVASTPTAWRVLDRVSPRAPEGAAGGPGQGKGVARRGRRLHLDAVVLRAGPQAERVAQGPVTRCERTSRQGRRYDLR